jgi:glycosyltransferase involved in cell wall biosynthesis
MELYKHMKVTSYAHECASINPELGAGVFKDCYYNLIEQMMYFPITTLIQTKQNEAKLLPKLPHANANLYVQPYPLTDSNVVYSLEKDGLLYIGRHEDRKNPGMYIKVLADIKEKYGVELKAKVLTRSAHVKKFEADFASIGHTNYEIKSDVVGEEKAKLIQSAKVAFMPYKNESFGIAVLEALRFMPTVVLDKYDWHYNFQSFSNYITASQKDAADVIWDAYNNRVVDETKVELEFTQYKVDFETALLNLVESPFQFEVSSIEPRFRFYSKMKEQKGKWLSIKDYFATENSKGTIYLTSDIETMYINRSWFQILHTAEDTYLGIADDNGQLVIDSRSNVSAALSSFFE